MDYFLLMRTFWDFAFENPDKIKPNHCALYSFMVEHCNRLGWKQKFGLPTTMAKDAIGIRSYNTYIQTLNDLVDFGFVEMLEKSKNQYSSNIVALSKYDKALDKALDKARVKHYTKQSESTIQSISSIDKHITTIPLTNQQETNTPPAFSFYNSLISYGGDVQLVSDWLKVRKNKKLTNTETALKSFLKEVDKSSVTINQVLKKCVENSWGGYKSEWSSKNATTTINNKPIYSNPIL